MKDERNNIVISMYKAGKRLRVINIPSLLLKRIIIINSLIIIGFFVFFLAYLSQWADNWRIKEANDLLKKEILLLKK